MNKRLDQLLKKREQLNAQINRIRAKEASQKRKEDTRRKILLGALVMEMMDRGELDREIIMKKLEGFLSRDIDRRLFDFSVAQDSEHRESTKGESTLERATAKGKKKSQQFEVILTDIASNKKLSVLKKVDEVTGLGLSGANNLIESAPKLVKKVATEAEAKQIQKQLTDAGAKVSVKAVVSWHSPDKREGSEGDSCEA